MPVPRDQLANTDEEWKALLNSDVPWVVRNEKDWEALLASVENPLKGIDDKLIEGFTKGLLFKNGGLAHANYAMLEDAMTLKQFRSLFEHFGFSSILLFDVADHYCEAAGTCSPYPSYVCTSNC